MTRRAADIVCHAGGATNPHRKVLAVVTIDGNEPPTLEIKPGVDWWAAEGTEPYLVLTCPKRRHRTARVDLLDLRRDMRSTLRRLSIPVLGA